MKNRSVETDRAGVVLLQNDFPATRAHAWRQRGRHGSCRSFRSAEDSPLRNIAE